jgi:nucleosome assembly protein 1-like 1
MTLNRSLERRSSNWRNNVSYFTNLVLESHKPLYLKRQEIISGAYEPTEKECYRKPLEDEPQTEDAQESTTEKSAAKVKGIPFFWLTSMKNIQDISEMITEEDEKALESLIDIQLTFIKNNDVKVYFNLLGIPA